MDCHQMKSVISLVDSLVRSTHVNRSRIRTKSPTDFSICSILGVESDVAKSSSSSECNSDASPPLSPYSDCAASPRPSYSATSPPLTPYSDVKSSSSDCDSGPDQTKKKRQRFSPIEVWELERAFRRQPYLLKEDEEELMQRLGITTKSLRYWFQNRRAKSRKLERKMFFVCQTSLSNQFVCRPYPDHWKQGERVSRPAMESYFRDINQRTVVSGQLSVKSDRVPKLHPDQFTIRPVEPTRLSYSRAPYRYQPY